MLCCRRPPRLADPRAHPPPRPAAQAELNTGSPDYSLQIITSFSGYTKTSWTANTNGIQQAYVAAWKAYFTSIGQSNALTLQIKAVDNSAAGVSVHARVFFRNNDKSACDALAAKLLSTAPGDNDYNEQYMSTTIFNAVANPTFGIVTRRSAMRACKKWEPPATGTFAVA